jgi:hypothetical protein
VSLTCTTGCKATSKAKGLNTGKKYVRKFNLLAKKKTTEVQKVQECDATTAKLRNKLMAQKKA